MERLVPTEVTKANVNSLIEKLDCMYTVCLRESGGGGKKCHQNERKTSYARCEIDVPRASVIAASKAHYCRYILIRNVA